MVIVIPADEEQKDVCVSFGRAPYFAVKDTEKEGLDFVKNPAADSEGGAGIQAAQTVLDLGASVLLTVRLGQNSKEVLDLGEVKIYKTEMPEIQPNIDAFLAGKLSPLTQFNPGYMGRK